MAPSVEIIDLTASPPSNRFHKSHDATSTHPLNSTPSKNFGKAKQRKNQSRDWELEDGEASDASGQPAKESEPTRTPNRHRHRTGDRFEKPAGRKRGREEYELDERDYSRSRKGDEARHRGEHSTSNKPSVDRPRDTSHSRGHTDHFPSSRSRLRSRSREPERHANVSSRSQGHHSRRSESPPLFCIDVTPADIPDVRALLLEIDRQPLESLSSATTDDKKLLLPPHVSVHEHEVATETGAESIPVAVEIIRPPTPDADGEDFIEYLDYDDRKAGLVRYFDEQAEQTKPTRHLCKNCGEEGDHKTFECPVLICLTCGARDEHSTRSCPISKTCFNCGMKGHINKTCPQRSSRALRHELSNYNDCDRCGSTKHKTNECPTLWRLYEYVTDHEREAVLRVREETVTAAGGYDAALEEWCYNCGLCGHWGDDCDKPRGRFGGSEPSAFGSYNISSGPFFEATASASKEQPRFNRPLRDWEGGGLNDDWGVGAPPDVGKRGRDKEKKNMQKRAQEVREEEDEDDWFGNAGRDKRMTGSSSHLARKGGDSFENGNRLWKKKMVMALPASLNPQDDGFSKSRDRQRLDDYDRDRRDSERVGRRQEHRKQDREQDVDYRESERDWHRARYPKENRRDNMRQDSRGEGNKSKQRYHGGYSR